MDKLHFQNCFFILITFIICSCSNYKPELIHAEKIMQDHPDSALMILSDLDTFNFRRKEKAKYSLLLSQALYRTGTDMYSDSIIKPALEYYKDNGSEFDRMLTHYYYGEILRNSSTIQDALIELQKAAEIGTRLKENFYMARILSSISILHGVDYNGEDALAAALKSKSLYKDLNDADGVFYSDILIAGALGCVNRYSEAHSMFLRLLNDTSTVAKNNRTKILIDYGALLYKIKKYDNCYNVYMHIYKIQPEMMNTYERTLLADLCIRKGDLNIAKEIISEVDMTTYDDKVFFYGILSEYYRKKELFEIALQYADSCYLYNSKDMSRILENNVVKYQRDQRQIDFLNANEQSRRRLYLVLILSLIIIFLISLIYSLYRLYRQKQRNMELKAMEQAMIFTQENSILREDNQRFKSLMAKQGFYIKALRSAYQRVDAICSSYFRSPESFKQKILLADVKHLVNDLSSPETVEALQRQLDTLYPGLFKALRSDFRLKNRSFLIMTYTLSGFSYHTTAYILNEKPGAVATQIHRLKRRILESDTPNLHLYRQAFGDIDIGDTPKKE